MLKTISLTSLALLAFAGNSILCRIALHDNVIDASSFTSIRLISGAIVLLILVAYKTNFEMNLKNGSWSSAFFLFLYATAFSFSYVTLETGIGALILFGSVQVTMVVYDLFKGRRLHLIEWLGLSIAFFGLITLLLPGSSTPSLIGFLLMAISGIGWGFYTLSGKGSANPLVDTMNNFIRTIPFVVLLIIFTVDNSQISNKGIALAIASGAVTSGLGYAIWYSALGSLTVIQAAVVQLIVPILAAFGGVLFSGELIGVKLMISAGLVLGGILAVTLGKRYVTMLSQR